MSRAWKHVVAVVLIVGSVADGRMLRPSPSTFFAGGGGAPQPFNAGPAAFRETPNNPGWSSSSGSRNPGSLSSSPKKSSPWTVNAADWNSNSGGSSRYPGNGYETPTTKGYDRKKSGGGGMTGTGQWNSNRPMKKPPKKTWNQGGSNTNWGKPVAQQATPPPPPPQRKDKVDWGKIEKQNPEGPLSLDLGQLWRKSGNGKREASYVAGDAKGCVCVDVEDCRMENRVSFSAAVGNVLLDARQSEVCAASKVVCCFSDEPFFEDATAAELRTAPLTPPCGERLVDRNGSDSTEEGLADYGSFPWVLRLVYDEDDWARAECSATLVHRSVALTTASCILEDSPQTIRVRAGDWNGAPGRTQERGVERILIHPEFDSAYLTNDLALLLLEEPFDDLSNACLPVVDDEVWDVDRCVVVGWSVENDNGLKRPLLRQIDLAIISQGKCRNSFNALQRDRNYAGAAEGDFFCAYAKDEVPCMGDDGSLLMCPSKLSRDTFSLLGLISRGSSCHGTSATFTNVRKVVDWITELETNRQWSY